MSENPPRTKKVPEILPNPDHNKVRANARDRARRKRTPNRSGGTDRIIPPTPEELARRQQEEQDAFERDNASGVEDETATITPPELIYSTHLTGEEEYPDLPESSSVPEPEAGSEPASFAEYAKKRQELRQLAIEQFGAEGISPEDALAKKKIQSNLGLGVNREDRSQPFNEEYANKFDAIKAPEAPTGKAAESDAERHARREARAENLATELGLSDQRNAMLEAEKAFQASLTKKQSSHLNFFKKVDTNKAQAAYELARAEWVKGLTSKAKTEFASDRRKQLEAQVIINRDTVLRESEARNQAKIDALSVRQKTVLGKSMSWLMNDLSKAGKQLSQDSQDVTRLAGTAAVNAQEKIAGTKLGERLGVKAISEEARDKYIQHYGRAVRILAGAAIGTAMTGGANLGATFILRSTRMVAGMVGGSIAGVQSGRLYRKVIGDKAAEKLHTAKRVDVSEMEEGALMQQLRKNVEAYQKGNRDTRLKQQMTAQFLGALVGGAGAGLTTGVVGGGVLNHFQHLPSVQSAAGTIAEKDIQHPITAAPQSDAIAKPSITSPEAHPASPSPVPPTHEGLKVEVKPDETPKPPVSHHHYPHHPHAAAGQEASSVASPAETPSTPEQPLSTPETASATESATLGENHDVQAMYKYEGTHSGFTQEQVDTESHYQDTVKIAQQENAATVATPIHSTEQLHVSEPELVAHPEAPVLSSPTPELTYDQDSIPVSSEGTPNPVETHVAHTVEAPKPIHEAVRVEATPAPEVHSHASVPVTEHPVPSTSSESIHTPATHVAETSASPNHTVEKVTVQADKLLPKNPFGLQVNAREMHVYANPKGELMAYGKTMTDVKAYHAFTTTFFKEHPEAKTLRFGVMNMDFGKPIPQVIEYTRGPDGSIVSYVVTDMKQIAEKIPDPKTFAKLVM